MPANARWTDLPQLPEAVAGQCVGTSGKWLIVAGGSLWSAPPWNGGVKTWSDRVYGLQPGASQWTLLGRLPAATGYAAGAQDVDALLCAGGQNGSEVFREVLRITVSAENTLQVTRLADLPAPLTNAAAAIAQGTLYVLGGQHTLQPAGIARQGQQLSLRPGSTWRPLPVPWKHPRILPAVAGCRDTVFAGGGADLSAGPDGTPLRLYLDDAWRFDTHAGKWHDVPALPSPLVAAPSLCSRTGEWILFGGDDGSLATRIQQLRDTHPGFRRQVLRLGAEGWQSAGELPLSLVTSGAVAWQGSYVIPAGENQPGHRSARVIHTPAP